MKIKEIILATFLWGLASSSAFYSINSWKMVLFSTLGFGIALFLLNKIDESLERYLRTKKVRNR